MPVATKIVRVSIYNEELPSINLHNPLITWPCKIIKNIRCYIYTTTRPRTTKLIDMASYTKLSMVIYYEKLPPSKLHNPLNT